MGDTRVVLLGGAATPPRCLSVDHLPTTNAAEVARVEAAGGFELLDGFVESTVEREVHSELRANVRVRWCRVGPRAQTFDLRVERRIRSGRTRECGPAHEDEGEERDPVHRGLDVSSESRTEATKSYTPIVSRR